ncbi:hypothetical protein HPB47_004072 [Ixodes persulcatus]|uniref:Uncharacterized protein n=1 Tax=Ixodes persulcatus TaxID=34615 RepID=A0AC60PHJ1_IXOPE|nr:hypothetical protein HPB47_004072 [Ixodes persulcatus]
MEKKKRKPGTRYCCVVGCSNNLRERTSKSLHFYRFPGKAYETQRRQAWITAVRRQNEDGSKWLPSLATRICSAHFVGNCKNDAEAHPSHIPTIFPPVYKKKAPNVERAKRMLKRSSRCQPMPPPVGTPPDPDTVSEPEATTEADSFNWDSFTTLVHTAAQATPTKCTSTAATQTDDEALDGGPLWLLLSATDGLTGSTQVTHTEQVNERDPQAHKGSCHVVEHLARFLHGCKEPHKPLFVHSPGDLGEHAVEDISAYGVIYTPGRKF